MVMIRSLTDKTIKFDFFCDMDYKMTKPRIMNIIYEAESRSAYICAVSSDQGGSNQGLFNKLGLTVKKPNFKNPYDETRLVHGFYDWIHAMKNVRNHMLDHVRISPKGFHSSKEDFEDLLPHISAEISPGQFRKICIVPNNYGHTLSCSMILKYSSYCNT